MCLLLLVVGSVYAQPVDPRSEEGSRIGQEGNGAFSPQGGPRMGPPAEAYAACKGKSVGNAATFINPRGETVTGTCVQEGSQLVLRPDNRKGQSGGMRHGPPPEAYKACEGKSAGATAQFINPRGKAVTGTCEEENGKMVLRPNFNKGGSK